MIGSKLLAVGCSLGTLATTVFLLAGDLDLPSTPGVAAPATATQPTEAVGHASAEAAATAMVTAIIYRDYATFLRTRMKSVCEDAGDWPARFAATLHHVQFKDDSGQYSIFDIIRPLNAESIRIEAVRALETPGYFAVSSYYAEGFVNVDVSVSDRHRRMFRTSIVVAELGGRWYGVPRRTRCPVYAVAEGTLKIGDEN
ncbi:MAG: hypothetical protein Fues2KO_31950 [Fuerstiella sp.]